MRIFFVLFLLLGSSALQAARQPTNLLFILSDNQPASIIGAYGNPDVRTPHIDRLASQGMLFTNSFAVNGLCSPTRATLMTGLLPSQHGPHDWLGDADIEKWPSNWSAVGEFRSLPYTLANSGYDTAMIGKWHLGQPHKPALGFQHWVTFLYGHTTDFWNNGIIDNGKTYEIKDQHSVDFFADKAVEYLAHRKGDKPFYLQLNLNGPYLNPPTNSGPARNRHYESYLDQDFDSFPRVAVSDNLLEQIKDPQTPKFLRGKHFETIEMHNDQASMANVASQNTMVDDAVGRVLKALDKNGLRESTLVVFSSDQGNFYGQHGLWQHTVVTRPANLYEAALNIPLIFRHPGQIAPGSVNDRLIGQYDLPVSLLTYLGVDTELENSPGRDFAPQLRSQRSAWTDEVFYEQEESRGIRTTRWAYWERLRGTGEPELYDMRADPGQHVNLADRKEHAKLIASLSSRLDEFFTRYADPKYDLWNGGTAKGIVVRPGLFRDIYGPDWTTETKLIPAFNLGSE